MPNQLNTTIFGPTVVRLFGRVINELSQLQPAKGAAAASYKKGAVPPLYSHQTPLTEAIGGADLKLAYILAYSNEGRYTPLRTPALFLVHTSGENVHDGSKQVDPARLGLAHLDGSLSFASDLMFWIYDGTAQTIRLDISSGALQQLLIDAEGGAGRGRRIDLVGQDSSFSGRLGQGSY